jgi:predicted dienelactone hydrolase
MANGNPRTHAPPETAVSGRSAWTGAAWGLVVALDAILAVTAFSLGGGGLRAVAVAVGVPLGLAYALAWGAAIAVLVWLAGALPARYRLALAGSAYLLFFDVFSGATLQRLIPTLWVIVPSTLVGGAIGAIRAWRADKASPRPPLLAVACLAAGVGAAVLGLRGLLGAGEDDPPMIDAAKAGPPVRELDLPDPSRPGDLRARRLFYGSGVDRRRPEYGAGVDLRTRTVDCHAIMSGWSGASWLRTRYWGFDTHALPLDGRLWVPEGEGPFPVVLVVHGNHPMEELSEPGYDYLGEHLASHGYVVALVDEDFLNRDPVSSQTQQQLAQEYGVRGYLLLEHLETFKGWNAEAESPLHGKLDLDRVALVGHSRGGEAIALAATFNRLSRYPDDANVLFHHGFGIRALVGLAPAEDHLHLSFDDIDYFTIEGSHDADVEFFRGIGQYDRVDVHGAGYHVKAAAYFHGGNHGQFNRVWGGLDQYRFPKRQGMAIASLVPAETQEQIAKAYVTAFLAVSLGGDRRYVPFLQDHRAGARWLPDTIYVSRFEDSTYRPVMRFDEDVDPTTTTLPGGQIAGEHLTTWREQFSQPWSFSSWAEGRAAYLGWDAASGETARYTVTLPEGALVLDPRASLVLTMADANEGPRPPGGGPRAPLDLTIELVDRAGHAARLPLGSASLLQPYLESSVWKAWTRTERNREFIFQTIQLPLAGFAAQEPALDVTRPASIRLVFDRTPAGVVVLRGLGFSSPPPP